ncbi:flagellar hook-associated family protein [Acuticoccus sp. M5D2P5]|uniref:flagellar hook-associated family protein n=1 Tax=Acuticoccus kalidii TaxID=2910977 RepID=UPI001F220ADD|nr:flagellar hook-associated family protein [Acuticoccus kalidii]MCF3932486.1 flagellar hook-associated family protein [Acuticoccus kalidii]
MQTSYISTAALRNAPRASVQRLQSELVDRTTEIATQRHADVGLTLGSGTGRTVSTRMDLALLETLMTSNAGATARLSQTQTALADLETVASEMLSALVALPPGVQSANTMEVQAVSSLDRLADRLNASDGGSYLFGGLNSTARPFNRYDNGPRAAVEAAFLAEFGVAVGNPASAAITPAAMETFLDNAFANLFDDPAWTTDWSAASSTNMMSRIAPSERTETSTNANEAAMRDLARGFTMIAGLGFTALSQETRNAIVSEARIVLGTAITEVLALKGELGFAENAIAKADGRMSLARDILSLKIADAEGADPAEAKVRIDLLTTQIEMSYALTNQLSRLSILNYA